MNESTSTHPVKPWLICFGAALFFLFVFYQLAMFNTIGPHLLKAFNLTAPQLGYLSSSYFFADAISIIPAGILLDRFSTRRIALIVMLICVLATYAFSATTSFKVAMLAHAINGMGNAFALLTSMQLAARWLPPKRLALGMGSIITIIMFGGIIAQTPMDLLINHIGWRYAVAIDASAGFAFLVYLFFVIEDHPHDLIASNGPVFENLLLAMKNPQNWSCALFTSLINLPVALLGELWGVMYLVEAHHLSTVTASEITSMIFIGMIIGSTAMGWISDFVQRRQAPMLISTILILIVTLLITYTNIHSIPFLMLLFFLLGLIASAQVLSYPTVAESNPPQITGTSMSIIAIVFNLINFVAQPLYGWLMRINWNGFKHSPGHPIYSLNDFRTAMIILPIAFIIAFLLTIFIRETRCKPFESTEQKNSESTSLPVGE